MFKHGLINKIITRNMHFTIEKEDDEKADETWIMIETLEQRNDKEKELFDYLSQICENPDESSYYHGCETFEDFEKKRDAKLVKKYGQKYIPTI